MMKISFKKWVKEYALAYILGLVLAVCFNTMYLVAVLGWEQGLAYSSKMIIMLLTGSVIFAGLLLKGLFLGRMSVLPDLILMLGSCPCHSCFLLLRKMGGEK